MLAAFVAFQTRASRLEQVSAEGAALVETQTNALFGDVKALTRQMQEAVGNVNSLEEVMKKVQVGDCGLSRGI